MNEQPSENPLDQSTKRSTTQRRREKQEGLPIKNLPYLRVIKVLKSIEHSLLKIFKNLIKVETLLIEKIQTEAS